jgi:hypothetical protein
MSFWLTNPIKLVNEVSVIPKVDQPLAERMNTLTRLVIIVAIVFYLLKFQGSANILIFGVFAIIILYYSQREKMSRFRLSPQEQGPRQDVSEQEYSPYATGERPSTFATAGETQPASFYVDPYSGAGDSKYRQYPVIPPSFAAASDWGGQDSRLNIASPMRVDGGIERFSTYADKISYARPARASEREVPRGVPRGRPRSEVYTPPQESPFRTFLTPGLTGRTSIPFSETVSEDDPRFSEGNGAYVYHVSRTPPGERTAVAARLNQGGGLVYSPSFQGEVERPLTWDPSRVGEARSFYQRSTYPSDDDERTGVHRSRTTGFPGRTAGEFQDLHDLPGYNMYFAGPKRPFEGLFATTSEQAHADVMDAEGNLYPRYLRAEPSDEDLVEATGNRQLADELLLRESLDATFAGRLAETDYEMRLAPMRRMPR